MVAGTRSDRPRRPASGAGEEQTSGGRPIVPLAKAAYEQLKRRIADCELEPGQWITERQVAEDLGLGLTPVRTALARLSNEGMVETVPRRGYRVAPLTIKSADDLFLTWRLIAPEIMRLVVRNLTPELLEEYGTVMRQALESGAGATDTSDSPDAAEEPPPNREEALRVSQAEWRFLAKACGNAYLAETYLRLESDLRRVFTLAFASGGELGQAIANTQRQRGRHFRFEDGDADRSAAMTEEFISRAHRRVLGILRSTPAAMSAELHR